MTSSFSPHFHRGVAEPRLTLRPANATAKIYGSGHNKISWISFSDVARFAVAALDKAQATQHVPEEARRTQHGAATDPLQQSFAGLMLYYAHGDAIDMANPPDTSSATLEVRSRGPSRDYLNVPHAVPTRGWPVTGCE